VVRPRSEALSDDGVRVNRQQFIERLVRGSLKSDFKARGYDADISEAEAVGLSDVSEGEEEEDDVNIDEDESYTDDGEDVSTDEDMDDVDDDEDEDDSKSLS